MEVDSALGGDAVAADGTAGDSSDRSASRRDLIRRAAKVSAVAWTVPLVIDGISNPAAAATCAKGTFWVAYQLNLAAVASATSCTTTAGYVNTTAAAVALTVAAGAAPAGSLNDANILQHDASTNGRARPVTLTIAGCSCSILRVMGVVHRRGPSTTPDCPSPDCQVASTAGTAPLRVTAGALNSLTVTVAPQYTSTLCPDPAVGGAGPGIHWGSPGVPNGKLVVEIRCG